ncbi:hypothetical protein RRG08_038693 [Elysia crispata]|uniref:Uncharacterized protein n=1 Tax=Elysia crispata TaxID=231223 RepID=A0AAE0ZJB5_9GAST|nr:hypothetical protein RRG08_038693 [Elysia crispata]
MHVFSLGGANFHQSHWCGNEQVGANVAMVSNFNILFYYTFCDMLRLDPHSKRYTLSPYKSPRVTNGNNLPETMRLMSTAISTRSIVAQVIRHSISSAMNQLALAPEDKLNHGSFTVGSVPEKSHRGGGWRKPCKGCCACAGHVWVSGRE